MSGRRQKALELRVRDHHGRRVHERMGVDGPRFPESAIDHEFHRAGRVVHEREEAHGPGRDAEIFHQPVGGCEAEPARIEPCRQRIEIDREIVRHLEGALPAECLEETIVSSTRRYAKRQETWFRHQLGAAPCLTLDATAAPEALAAKVAERWEEGAR